MICTRCLRRASCRIPQSSIPRFFSTSRPFLEPTSPPAATSTGLAQPFTNPLTPSPSSTPLPTKPKSSLQFPISNCKAGTRLKGLNYLKGRDDPVALEDEEYPEWLWRCLDVKKKGGDEEGAVGDLFSKSKKLRRKAAKQQRKLEAQMLASGDMSALQPKIPLTQQSIDLPGNEEGTVEGALEADSRRQELRAALRGERRKSIKEANYLKSM
ncbi:mitochondrial ribosomal protein subunit L37 [Hyaloscypha finlandica]|nr:mitochondrial ribosomal protein subunit L37 [Hyaloscypha finlandica]